MPTEEKKLTRVEFGHAWEWRDSNKDMRGNWRSTQGNPVRVFPPSENIRAWTVMVCNEEEVDLYGEDAEKRAFCTAESLTRQQRP